MIDIENLAKSQKVRVFDIYALGPFMIWYAMKSKGMGRWPRRALFISGAMTIVYNFGNYKKVAMYLKEHGKDIIQNPLDALGDLVQENSSGGFNV